MNAITSTTLLRSNVTISGNKNAAETIVFLHGLGSDQTSWRHLAPAFEDRYQVVLLDLIGAGKSDLQAYSYAKHASLAAHADDLLAVLHELTLYNVVFVGHSISSMIGVLAAIKEPARFGRLVLLTPSPRFINAAGYAGGFEQKDINELLAAMENNYHGWSQGIAPVMMGADSHELILELTNSFLQTNPAIAQHFARVTFLSDHRADLPHLTTPSLILQCAHDVIAPLAVGEYMHKNLPDSQLVVIDTPGHSPHLTAPDLTLREIEFFLQLAPVFPR
ncbi:alpha/beta fold hydrolase [Hymenobacter sp. HMF4947]|uniref:Alpha/beta fold hydrolase n=1 Tax=Hymenobacter ginkgonis TaxID=2682976 RepID=A0A7K1TC88_9BACT|nr:alpha/beta hydrolase [Hymenobacter ginkgonis]MVN75995.1 alpha/beta fold hydrolase [Hymenobacter ginkgonis]